MTPFGYNKHQRCYPVNYFEQQGVS
uniref:Uncharacterized protein n=1 Tax=Rhizophora mucronata TaxID=61149 RepID=A0A2P2QRS9_RHIMU